MLTPSFHQSVAHRAPASLYRATRRPPSPKIDDSSVYHRPPRSTLGFEEVWP